MKKQSELRKILLSNLKPPPRLSVSEWADKYRQLPTTSAEPGQWKTSRVPYMREVMDAFTQIGVHRVAVKSSSQVGKALDVETLIPTPAGFKKMCDLEIGDKVFDETGKVSFVTGVSEIFYNHKCYDVEFSDGAKIIADSEHNWFVADHLKEHAVQEKKLTTEEIAKTFKFFKGKNRNRYSVKVAGALQLSEKDLPVEPYTYGYWLGDGDKSGIRLTIFEDDLELVDFIKSEGYGVTIGQKAGRAIRLYVVKNSDTGKNFYAQMKANNFFGEKRIPEEYLISGTEQRLRLLQGIMDADGSVSSDGVCSISQMSQRLAKEIQILAGSLGFKARLRETIRRFKGKEKSVYTVAFTAYRETPVFRLRRKRLQQKKRSEGRAKITFNRFITSVSEVESRPTRCITVSSPSRLYLAGENYIPTHNSEVLLNVIGRFVMLDPCNMLLIQPTLELAQDFSKDRLSKMISDTKVLTPLFYGDKETSKSREKTQTMLSKFFKGGRLVLAGANSAAGLASRPVRILLCDEVDRFPPSASGNEGDPVDLAQKRMTTYWNYCMGLFSTPTTLGMSRIDMEYEAGTQEEWQHKCPKCGSWNFLDYTQMNCEYEKGAAVVVKSVSWQCPECGYDFSESEMRRAEQKYIAKNPDALKNGSRSFWITGFASPWLSWNEIMREWLEARGNPQREKVVMNTRFGKSYEELSEAGDENELLRRLEKYEAEIPMQVKVLTGAVDVQDNRLEYEICGWAENEECFGVQKGIIYGKPNKQRTWSDLDIVLDKIYYKADGTGLKVARTFIDSGGHFTSEVYGYCRKNIYKGRLAIKGQGGAGIPLLYKYAKTDNLPVLMLGVNDGKQEVMTRLSIESGEKKFHFPAEDEYSRGYDEVYFKGLLSEHAVVKWKGGQMYKQWEPISKHVRNEPLDLRVYNLASYLSLKGKEKPQAKAKVKGRRMELF